MFACVLYFNLCLILVVLNFLACLDMCFSSSLHVFQYACAVIYLVCMLCVLMLCLCYVVFGKKALRACLYCYM